jgi:Flp pilus assembly protein TadG
VTRRRDGQVIVLFALVLLVLMGISALVIDIGFKYSSERRMQAVTDAASLAGAQELQPTTRISGGVTGAMQRLARLRALDAIADELLPDGVSTGCGDGSSDVVGCILPGGQFTVSVLTPSPNCVDCAPERAVQVTVTEPEHPTSFARLFGQSTWSLSRTSVAGLSFGKNYAIVALRPIKPLSGSADEVRDIRLDGGTHVYVHNGDVGTNSNMEYASCSSLLVLDPDYKMYHYDDPPAWCTNPDGHHIGALIKDPKYPYPGQPGPPVGVNPTIASIDTIDCGPRLTALTTDAQYAKYLPLVPTVPSSGAIDPTKVKCYKPGTYSSLVSDSNGHLTILLPGLYYFNGGLNIQSSIIGGYNPAEGGVSLVFPRDKAFKQRNGAVVLNAGTRFQNPDGIEPPTAPAMTNQTPSVKMTLIVQWDPACPVQLPYPGACHDNPTASGNYTTDLAGGGGIYLAGVQYMPSDNVTITGNSSSEGYVGQIWAWTLNYKGNDTVINQEGFSSEGPGILRIDTACSPGESCP